MTTLRPAAREDLDYLLELSQDPLVAPFLAPRSVTAERLESLLDAGAADGGADGLFVIEAGAGQRAGGLTLSLVSRNSRICELSTLMIDPPMRRSGVGTQAVSLACRRAFVESSLHRVQAETYGDNLGAQRLFERVGFVREGVRRRAYWRRDRWLDGVLFGMLAEELE